MSEREREGERVGCREEESEKRRAEKKQRLHSKIRNVCGVKQLIHHGHVRIATSATHSNLLYKMHLLGQQEHLQLSDAHSINFHVRFVSKINVN